MEAIVTSWDNRSWGFSLCTETPAIGRWQDASLMLPKGYLSGDWPVAWKLL